MVTSVKLGQWLTIPGVGRELQCVIVASQTIGVIIGGWARHPLSDIGRGDTNSYRAPNFDTRNAAETTSKGIHHGMLAVLMVAPTVLEACGERPPPPSARWCHHRQEAPSGPIYFKRAR